MNEARENELDLVAQRKSNKPQVKRESLPMSGLDE